MCAYDFACNSLNVACIFMYACIEETACECACAFA